MKIGTIDGTLQQFSKHEVLTTDSKTQQIRGEHINY